MSSAHWPRGTFEVVNGVIAALRGENAVAMADHLPPLVFASVGDDTRIVVAAPRALADDARLEAVAAAIVGALEPA